MPQGIDQSQKGIQIQSQTQTQTLSPQQVAVARALEKSIMEVEDMIETKLGEGIITEESSKGSEEEGGTLDEGRSNGDEEGDSGKDNSGDGYPNDEPYDNDGETYVYNHNDEAGKESIVGNTVSCADELISQIYEYELTERQQELIKHLIGSLDNNGFLQDSLHTIADDLLLNHEMEVTVAELEETLKILQDFEPKGIGAKDLKESLIIQLRGVKADKGSDKDKTRNLALAIVDRFFNDLEQKQFDYIARKLKVPREDVENAVRLIAKMNPAPGRALNESASDRVQTAKPDVIIETDADDRITYTVSSGNMPRIMVNPVYVDKLNTYRDKQAVRRYKEAYDTIKKDIDEANIFINAIAQRQHTISVCTKAIIELQRDFILSQDDKDLKPMILEDVAKKAGVDISTVSRVKSNKFFSLNGDLYPFKHLFVRTRTNAQGEEIIGNEVKDKIHDIIEGENRRKPLKDEEIVAKLKKRGMNISRRTVAKYRMNLGYPIASRRKLK